MQGLGEHGALGGCVGRGRGVGSGSTGHSGGPEIPGEGRLWLPEGGVQRGGEGEDVGTLKLEGVGARMFKI